MNTFFLVNECVNIVFYGNSCGKVDNKRCTVQGIYDYPGLFSARNLGGCITPLACLHRAVQSFQLSLKGYTFIHDSFQTGLLW
jgi:hypothetical protein